MPLWPGVDVLLRPAPQPPQQQPQRLRAGDVHQREIQHRAHRAERTERELAELKAQGKKLPKKIGGGDL